MSQIKKHKKNIKRVLTFFLSMFFIGLLILFSAFYHYSNSVINKSSYDDFKKHDNYLLFDQIPSAVKDGFVAIEDKTFWTNRGYDIKSIARGILHTIKSGGKEIQGGSGITQQLVKNTYLTQERTISRKIKELFIATKLTRKYSKKEILEFYINNSYYANNCYTVDSAARLYFGTEASNLTISQCAYLCAIPNSPTRFDPFNDSTAAIQRRNMILEKMYEKGDITEKEYNEAIAEKIEILK